MYFRIHFCILIHQHFQSSFFTLRFLPENRIFPFGTGFAYSCTSGQLPDKTTKTSTKETYHVLPNTPHRHRHHQLLHHPKNPRHLTLNQRKPLCSHYHSSSAASPPSTTSSNTSTATNNKTSKEACHVHHPRILRHRHHRLNAILPTNSLHIYLLSTNPRCHAHRGFFRCFGRGHAFFREK